MMGGLSGIVCATGLAVLRESVGGAALMMGGLSGIVCAGGGGGGDTRCADDDNDALLLDDCAATAVAAALWCTLPLDVDTDSTVLDRDDDSVAMSGRLVLLSEPRLAKLSFDIESSTSELTEPSDWLDMRDDVLSASDSFLASRDGDAVVTTAPHSFRLELESSRLCRPEMECDLGGCSSNELPRESRSDLRLSLVESEPCSLSRRFRS